MIRIALAGLLGAIVLFGCDVLAWNVLGLHKVILEPLPEQSVTLAMLGDERGGFYFTADSRRPGIENSPATSDASGTPAESGPIEQALHNKLRIAGIVMRGPQPTDLGRDAAMAFMVYLVTALVAAFLVAEATAPAQPTDPLASYRYRLVFFAGLGVLAAFVTDLPYWLWLGFDTGYTWFMVAYRVLAWFIVGLFMASLITPSTRSLLELASHTTNSGNQTPESSPSQPVR